MQLSYYNTSTERQCNSTDTKETPDFINSANAMSEEEKEEAFMDYTIKRYHNPFTKKK
jgi:hypothetical protein